MMSTNKDVAEFVLATSDDARVMDGRKVRGGFHVSECALDEAKLRTILMREP